MTNKGHGVVNVLGGHPLDAPDRQIPRVAIEAEHYGRIARSLALLSTASIPSSRNAVSAGQLLRV